MKRILAVLAAAVVCVAIGFGSARAGGFLVTTVGVKSIGPFVSMDNAIDSAGAPSNGVGGIVKTFIAKSTDTLKLGDVVAIDTNNVVTKSATEATCNKVAGAVVGGRSTSMRAFTAAADVGSTAALPNRPVIVMTCGRTWVPLDTTTGGVTAGGLISGCSAIAGKVRPKRASLDSLYRVVGRAVNGGAISTTILADIRVK